MKGRNLKIIAVAVVAVVIISAAAVYIVKPKDEKKTTTIRIGVLPVVDTLALYVAEEEGLFNQSGVNVELVQFSSAQERDTAFTTGQIDGYFGDLINTLVLKNAGLNVKLVTVDAHTNTTVRMFGLVSSPGSSITNISQIDGQKVATSSASVTEYVLDRILEESGKTGSVTKELISQIAIRYQALMNDTSGVELALLPEPFLTKAIAGGAHLLATDCDLNFTTTVIAMNGDFIAANTELVRSFLTAYNVSVTLVNQDPWAYSSILENDLHMSSSLIGTFQIPALSSPILPSQNDVDLIQSWLVEKGKLSTAISYSSLVPEGLYA